MRWTVVAFRPFLKDMANLPKAIRKGVEEFAFRILPATENPYALPKIEKLKGYKDFFKARFGDFRLGLRIVKAEKTIELRCVKHRKDIYRNFP
jgi:mRNA interferase RelE/StbE